MLPGPADPRPARPTPAPPSTTTAPAATSTATACTSSPPTWPACGDADTRATANPTS